MTSSRSGATGGGGRSVTRMPDVTSRQVNEKLVTVEFDARTFVPIGAHATSFKSYLGVMAKAHVPIVATCWDDVPQVDKNLLWQDILPLSRGRSLMIHHTYCHAKELGLESPDLAPLLAMHELWKAARTKSNGQFTSQSAQEISQRIVYRPEKQPSAQPVNETREEAEDHDVISILTSKLNKLRKGPVEML
ncbi:hypothetical protein LR48_Vigan07g121300 [Vigna angularis]|uniref:Uncharacterized protein n=1 Tax=Phaseolus angularis TaxID=3914 RepID=A0A0L9UYA0_PHAAN|nr:hypothetical protein LR48_Vigan07g121300 [Vigna angularis]